MRVEQSDKMSQSGYNLPRFWEVTWAQTYSTVLGRNITEVEPTNLRQHQVYIEVGWSLSARAQRTIQMVLLTSGLHQLALLDLSLPDSYLYPDSFQHSYLQVEYWLLLYLPNNNNQSQIYKMQFYSNCSGKWEKLHLFVQIFQGNFFSIRKLNILIRFVSNIFPSVRNEINKSWYSLGDCSQNWAGVFCAAHLHK